MSTATTPSVGAPSPGRCPVHERVLDRRAWDLEDWLNGLLAQDPGVLDARDEDGNTALHVALETHWRPGVMALLQRGANPLLVNALGQDARAIWEAEGDDLDHPVRRALEEAELRVLASGRRVLPQRERTRL